MALRRIRLGIVGSVSIAAIMATQPVFAAGSDFDFNVPRGDLGQVLTAVARTARRSVSFRSDLVAGKVAGPIVGRESVAAALAQALVGSNLTVVNGPSGTLTLRSATASKSAGAGPTDIADIDVSGFSSPLNDDGFQAGDAGTTTRVTGASAREIPLAVTSVTKDVLDQEGATSAIDALKNVAGVQVSPSQDGSVPTFVIRGFQNSNIGIDGDYGGQAGTVPVDDIERVEVLKGPTSILTGVTSDGGLVNITTKQPTDRTIRDVTVRYGSFGYKTLAFDLGGIVPQTEGLTYRLNMSANTADQNYAGYKDPHEYLISPVVKWQNNDTSVTAGVRFYQQRIVGGDRTFLPYDFDAYDPNQQPVKIQQGIAKINPYLHSSSRNIDLYSDQSHDFGKFGGIDITINNHIKSTRQDADYHSYTIFPYLYGGSIYVLPQQINQPFSYQSVSERPNVELKYDGSFFRQYSKIGYDYQNYLTKQTYNRSGYDFDYDFFSTNQNYPIYSGTSASAFTARLRSVTTGVYYLEKFDTFNDRLHILGLVREDKNVGSGYYSYTGINTVLTQSGFSWTAGAAFDLTNWFTVYGNRNHAFVPATTVNATTGQIQPAETRDQQEVGGRFYFFNKKLTVTTSFYQLDQANVTIADPNDPTGLTSILIGGERSRGFEFEATGQVFPGMNVTAAFTDTHAAYTNPLNTIVLTAIPQITANIFATYAIQSGPLHGVFFGGGAHGLTSSPILAYDGLPRTLPGYVVGDLVAGYNTDKYSLQFNMNNFTNKYYYSPSTFANFINVGERRNYLLTAKYHF